MHACGHDANTAILIGTAMLLSKSKPKGTVKFIFQPSEEKPPGGAMKMIEEGVLENPQVDALVAVHVNPELDVGHFGFRYGPTTAASDIIDVIIRGKGGHGAYPHRCVDPIPISAEIILACQTIVSRRISPLSPVVITFGKISGGDVFNVIPDEVHISGTVRTLDSNVQEFAKKELEKIIPEIAKAYGASAEVFYQYGYPAGNSHRAITEQVFSVAQRLFGDDKTHLIDKPSMGGEDMAYFTRLVPGTCINVGVRNEEKGYTYPWHHSRFNLDESALPLASQLLAEIAHTFVAA